MIINVRRMWAFFKFQDKMVTVAVPMGKVAGVQEWKEEPGYRVVNKICAILHRVLTISC